MGHGDLDLIRGAWISAAAGAWMAMVRFQRSVAEAAGRFIGIEPDPAVVLGDYFTEAHRCRFGRKRAPWWPGRSTWPTQSWSWDVFQARSLLGQAVRDPARRRGFLGA